MLWHGVPICFLISNLRPRPAIKSALCLHCDSKCDFNPCEHRARRGRDTDNMHTTCDNVGAKTAGPARGCSGGLLCRIAEYAAAANERGRPTLEVADPPDVRWAESNKTANEQSSAKGCALVRYGVNETGNSVVCFVRFLPHARWIGWCRSVSTQSPLEYSEYHRTPHFHPLVGFDVVGTD